MDRIIALLFDPTFWFATILVGFVLSIVANFATDSIKQFWGKLSAKQRERNQKEQERIIAEAQKCLRSESYLQLCAARLSDLSNAVILGSVGAFFPFMGTGILWLGFIAQGLPNRIVNGSTQSSLDIDMAGALTNNMFTALLKSSPATYKFWLLLCMFFLVIGTLMFMGAVLKASLQARFHAKILKHAKWQLSEQLESLPPDTGKPSSQR